MLWQHAPAGSQNIDLAPKALASVARTILSESPRSVDAKASLSDSWQGLALQGGDCLKLVFERRALFPW